MSEQMSSNRPPAQGRSKNARPIIMLVALCALVVWGGIWLSRNASAISRLSKVLRSDKEAKAALQTYMDALCAGDLKTAATLSADDSSKEWNAKFSEMMPKFGAVKNVTYKLANYYSNSDDPRIHTLYYMEGYARFEHGATEFNARVWQVGDQWKVHDFGFYPGPRDPNGKTDLAAAPAAVPNAPTADHAPEMSIDVKKQYVATIETERGSIVIDLFPKEAPITVNNFVVLARKKFYNGLRFHRVIANFMIQGGDPDGTGQGGPGYAFEDETDPDKNPHTFKAGTLAMANAGPNTNGSQFFITHKPTPWLQGKHTIFGQVRDDKSQAVVNAIQQDDVMKSITIEESAK